MDSIAGPVLAEIVRSRDFMMSFFNTQLDFIFFFYGLAFILLGTTCIALGRSAGPTLSWRVLALFGLLHGAGEWLDLTALVIGDSQEFAVVRTAIMTVSFVFLLEFARREAIRLGMRLPGPWLHLPLLLFVAAAGMLEGLDAAGAIARYAIGFSGAMATGLVFVRLARGFSNSKRSFAICAAAGFMLYAVAAGLIVPSSSFWPASVFNYGWFNNLTGIPIQLARGILACWMAFSIWAIWGQQLIIEVSSKRYTRFLQRQFVWTVALMTVILVAGWVLTEFLGGIYRQNVAHEARGDIDLLASRLAGETATVEGIVRSLAGSPSILPLLTGGSSKDFDRGRSVLDLDVEASGAEAGFILDRSGAVVARSGRGEGAYSSGSGPADAPYFQKSLAGEPAYYFAFNPQNGSPDYFASYPIRADNGAVIGVAVLVRSLDDFAADLEGFDRPYFLIDADGVVALSNRPGMLHRMLWPLPAGQRAMLVRQFGAVNEQPVLEQEVKDATWITADRERNYVRRRYAGHSRWSLVILKPTREIYATRVLGIVVTLLVAMMTLIYLFGKERWVHDNVQMEKRLKLQELAQNLRSQATTDTLTGLYNRLKFDQALVAEIGRAARYKTPLSLVLYDIDAFKKVNDTHGHQTGDRVLIQLSNLVAGKCRSTDMLSRWGGEEFAIMLAGADGPTAEQAAEKIRVAIAGTTFGVAGKVTCSFGVAQFVDGDTAETLLSRADDALYRAKMKGRNRVERALPPNDATGLASVA